MPGVVSGPHLARSDIPVVGYLAGLAVVAIAANADHEEGAVAAAWKAPRYCRYFHVVGRLAGTDADPPPSSSLADAIPSSRSFDATAWEEPVRPIAVAQRGTRSLPSMTTPCAPSVSPLRNRAQKRRQHCLKPHRKPPESIFAGLQPLPPILPSRLASYPALPVSDAAPRSR